MGETEKGKLINEGRDNYVVFDLETTGLSWLEDDIVEIAGIKVINGAITEEFSSLVKPSRSISYYAGLVNGITDEMVSHEQKIDVVLKDFLDFTDNLMLVGHNIAAFDMRFIRRDAKRFFGQEPLNDYSDTLVLASMYLPHLKKKSLACLADYYRIPVVNAHRALYDCKMNQRVYEELKKEADRGVSRADNLKICPKCGNLLRLRNGRFGKFYGCTSYPECTYTERYHEE